MKGCCEDEPLWRLLGGHRQRVKAYAGGIDLQFTQEALLAQTEQFLAQGFRAIKMKVGRARLSEDLARVAAMRERLGAGRPVVLASRQTVVWGPQGHHAHESEAPDGR